MQLSSLSTSSYYSPNGRFKERRAAVRTMMAVGAAKSSLRSLAETQSIPTAFEESAPAVNPAYIYKPMADLLGLIADSDAGVFGGSVDGPPAADFLGDLSWLLSPRGADAAAPAASASLGLASKPFSSLLAVNAAYESSKDSDAEEI